MMCNNPDWLPWVLAAYPLLVHARTLLPVQAQGVAGVVLKILDVVAANYGSATNKVVDEQDKVTPRPEV
jgi:hypothetical protein